MKKLVPSESPSYPPSRFQLSRGDAMHMHKAPSQHTRTSPHLSLRRECLPLILLVTYILRSWLDVHWVIAADVRHEKNLSVDKIKFTCRDARSIIMNTSPRNPLSLAAVCMLIRLEPPAGDIMLCLLPDARYHTLAFVRSLCAVCCAGVVEETGGAA